LIEKGQIQRVKLTFIRRTSQEI